jgi:hypothetical protein
VAGEVTYWQAVLQSAKEAGLAFLWLTPPAAVGLVGGWLLWTHRYVALVVCIVAALVAAVAISAWFTQRRANRNTQW